MSSYYDAFGGTSTEGPDDPFADDAEIQRRDEEMEPDEPDYSDIDALDWGELNDEADSINIITGEVEQ